jgi:hypothetical protein
MPTATETPKASQATRQEKDSLGYKDVPAEVYYGIQTLRGKENFPKGKLPHFRPDRRADDAGANPGLRLD